MKSEIKENMFPENLSEAKSRRRFLSFAGAFAAATYTSQYAFGATYKNVPTKDYPFSLGVASGDPSHDGVVLWTRLAPDPLIGGGMPNKNVEVDWQICTDERMTKVIQSGKVAATPQWAHSIHVEVSGLEPGREYWYQFKVGSETSPKGRTKTLPPLGSSPEKLRFAFASCQHFEAGLFTAYEHMLKDDIDMVLHLGDYIYEGAATQNKNPIRTHVGDRLTKLDDYRNRHAQYKTDSALQAVHAHFPWFVTFDDHEVENNYAASISQSYPRVTEAAFLRQRAAAYQAYYEHMPLRRSSLPTGPDMRLYRSASFGNLAEFQILDTRQYRTDQPCGDKKQIPCDGCTDPKGTILGEVQEKWLLGNLSKSSAKWNILAQQVIMSRIDHKPGAGVELHMDQWPGYETCRNRLLKHLHENKIANPVVLTGDNHANWAIDISLDEHSDKPIPVGTEIVGTSISSGGDGSEGKKRHEEMLSENPFVKLHNDRRGYVRCEVNEKEWKTDFQIVDYVRVAGAPGKTLASFVIESGRPTLNRA